MDKANFEEREAWQRILLEQAAQRPQWQLQDLYKLAFQAALGSEHAAPGEAAARRWLEDEIAMLGAGPEDLPIEGISPDGRLVRVNLWPYFAVGGDMEGVLQAFLRTAAAWRGTRQVLQQYTAWAVELAAGGGLAFSAEEMHSFFDKLAEAGYPAAHHSAIYREEYQLAYRVVMRAYLPPIHP